MIHFPITEYQYVYQIPIYFLICLPVTDLVDDYKIKYQWIDHQFIYQILIWLLITKSNTDQFTSYINKCQFRYWLLNQLPNTELNTY